METTKEVYYPGGKTTQHELGLIKPGINRLDRDVADKLLKIGFVTEIPREKGNPYQDKTGKFCKKEEDADGKPRYRKSA